MGKRAEGSSRRGSERSGHREESCDRVVVKNRPSGSSGPRASEIAHLGLDKRQAREVRILPIAVAGDVGPGQSLAATLLAAVRNSGEQLQQGDILVVKHKVVSKSEGAMVALAEIRPSARTRAWARRYRLDARVSELALREGRRIVRRKKSHAY